MADRKPLKVLPDGGGDSAGLSEFVAADTVGIADGGTGAVTASAARTALGVSPTAGSSSIVTTGALDSGSITSNFGTIDTGSSAITTTGVITGGTVEATTDTAAGDNAAMGYTSAEGLILTGQGSASDVTIKNDADETVISIPTGTSQLFLGDAAASGNRSNASMTMGLTINQEANDNEIFACKSSDVAHGITCQAETDTYGCIKKQDANGGGLWLEGLTEGATGLELYASVTSTVTTKSSSAGAAIALQPQLKSGTSVTNPGTDSNLVSIRNGGTGAVRFIFDAEGSGHADVEWTTYSDSRLKKNVVDCPYGLAEVLQLKPKTFDKHSGMIDEDNNVVLDENSRRMIGFLAQDVKALMPELVKDLPDDKSFYSLNEGKLAAVLVNAIQELNAKLEAI